MQAFADACHAATGADNYGTYPGHSPPEGPTQALDIFNPTRTLGLGIGAMARAEAFPPRSVEEESDLPRELDTADFAGPDGTGFEFVTIRLHESAPSADLSRIVATATRIASISQQQIRTEQRPIAIDN